MNNGYMIIPALKRIYKRSAESEKVDKILNIVSAYYNVEYSEMKGISRRRPIPLIRHMAFYLLRRNTNMSLIDIAKIFDRDHTTIIHGIKNIENIRLTDRKIAFDISYIESSVYGIEFNEKFIPDEPVKSGAAKKIKRHAAQYSNKQFI